MDTSKKINSEILIPIALFIVIICAMFFVSSFFYKTSIINVVGNSMNPTLSDGQKLTVNSNKKPIINDIIVFNCFSKCLNSGKSDPLIKRLTKINEQGCYWVEGDNHEHSNDSVDFGWLCPSDIRVDGVVILKS